MREPLPLAKVHEAVLQFLMGRQDAALFGAQAVNAYVGQPRMTQDVDILATDAAALAEPLRKHLADLFHIAVWVRVVGEGRGYRLFQVCKPANRHLVDIRPVLKLPPTRCMEGITLVAPAELIAQKVVALHRRQGKPKSGTDWRDLAMLLLAFSELKTESGPVRRRLEAAGADDAALTVWTNLVAQKISPEEDEDEFET